MSPAKTLLAIGIAATFPVSAQWPFGGFNRISRPQMPRSEIVGTARLEPSRVVVGEPCAIIVELTVDKGLGVEDIQVGGLPDADSGVSYGDGFENLADRALPTNRVLKSFRLPARFLTPREEDVRIFLQGMLVSRQQQGGMSFSSSSSFTTRLDSFRLDVQPLPTARRPTDFSGAIGTKFLIKQTLSSDHVHPGDLITATYELAYDGYCPSNIWPRIERLSREFKTYDPKEVARTDKTITWTQVLVPRTTAATNTPLVSLDFFNVRTKRYEVARAYPKKLVFVSNTAASTENTSVVVTTDKTSSTTPVPTSSGSLVLRLAPSDKSPILATLPSNTPVRVLSKTRNWQRVETERAIGWTRQ